MSGAAVVSETIGTTSNPFGSESIPLIAAGGVGPTGPEYCKKSRVSSVPPLTERY